MSAIHSKSTGSVCSTLCIHSYTVYYTWTKNVCISPSNFSFIYKASTHTCTHILHIGLLFVVGAVAAAVAAVAFAVAVFAVDELSSMLCFIPKRIKRKTMQTKWRRKDDGLLVDCFSFSPLIHHIAIHSFDWILFLLLLEYLCGDVAIAKYIYLLCT